MKAILFSIGTRGDIEPFLAIAQILKEKDWDIICVFPEQFRKTVEDMDIPFKGFSREFLDMMESKEAKMVMGGHGSIFLRIRFLIKMARDGMKISKGMLSFQHRIQQEEKPDKIIYHPKCNYSLLWGMANSDKTTMVSPIPGTTHTIKHLNIFGNFGSKINTFIFWLSNTMKAIVLKRVFNKYKDDYSEFRTSFWAIKRVMLEKEKTLYTISSSLFARPNYWPTSAQVVGYYERNKAINWLPENSLLEFMKTHEKIVFVSFGSMSNANPKEKTSIIIDVLTKNNIPAIINTSWGGLEKMDASTENIHFVSDIPYDWVFPKVYAVVHHGGSGTTHTALKYGCPSLIIPHIIDQFFWKNTIANLKLGPKGFSIKKLKKKNFESKVLDLFNNDQYKTNAGLISEKIKSESDKEKLYHMIVN